MAVAPSRIEGMALASGEGVATREQAACASFCVVRVWVLAVLLTYRALYYLAPLLVATLMDVLFEARVKKGARGE